MRKNYLRIILPIIIFIGGFLIASLFTSPKTVSAQACTTPAQVPNVEVEYPSCDATGNCNFTQASCSWGTVNGAANFQVTVTEVESGTTVYNQQVPAATLTVTFAITQNRTYKCDVSAINSCGQAGPAGTHSLLCSADAAVTVTTAPPAATTAPVVAKPVVPVVGSTMTYIAAAMAGFFLLAGFVVFLI